jgi:serine-type D-Ala-D-Ala carboxypeptidase (penicillin-binding protein 5/6)
MKKLAAIATIAALTTPAAANPEFNTPAPVAYMIDLQSNAVLYSKDADRRMPPASLAKMMTVYVVFDLIKKGELSPDKQFTVRPETWRQWHGPQAGSTMFLSVNENVSVDNLL